MKLILKLLYEFLYHKSKLYRDSYIIITTTTIFIPEICIKAIQLQKLVLTKSLKLHKTVWRQNMSLKLQGGENKVYGSNNKYTEYMELYHKP